MSGRGDSTEVFRTFLRLGLASFGGPIAHLGYLRAEFVVRRRWLDEEQFAQLLALCQFLPGPASSQAAFAIGLFRAGWAGAIAAFVAFTLPSALLMVGFAWLAPRLQGGAGAALVHGLKLVAVVVVAQGLYAMARQLTPDLRRLAIAVVAAVFLSWAQAAWAQLLVIALGAAVGAWLCREARAPGAAAFTLPHTAAHAGMFLLLFLLGLAAALACGAEGPASPPRLAAAFYRAGALVFGGGHVVLPLLQQGLVAPGWVRQDAFLAGYGAAQAVPGPMFSIAAYLGAETHTGWPAAANALLALLAIFLPGFLLLLAALPLWARGVRKRWAAPAMAGVNAAVVGLLAAAFHDPVCTQGLRAPADFGIVALGLLLLAGLRASALWVVAWCVASSVAAWWLA